MKHSETMSPIVGAIIGIVMLIATVLSGCGDVNEAITHSAKILETVESADYSVSELSAIITPEPTPIPTPEPATDMSPLPETWFDDAVFFGDSISVVLGKHAEKTGELGKALFLCEFSYSVRNAVSGYLKIWYHGEQYLPQDVLGLTGATKVFTMLGVNDVALPGGVDRTLECWAEYIAAIREKNPDIQIFIESCLPVYYEFSGRNNEMLDGYNERLRELCEETGCIYVDVAHYLKDENNKLALEYCSDMGEHITYEGAAVWAEQLKNPENYSVNPRSLEYGNHA